MPSSRPDESGTRSTTVGLVVRTVSSEKGDRSLCCPDCKLQLNLIQPDENEPSRFLGTCDACAKWFFLIEMELDWKTTTMIELPTRTALQGQPATASDAAKSSRSKGPGTHPRASSAG